MTLTWLTRFASAPAALALPAAAVATQDLSALARLVPEGSAVVDAGAGVRIDLALSQPVPYRVFVLDDPPRLARDARDEAEALGHYRRVRDQIGSYIRHLPRQIEALIHEQ